MRLAVGLRAGWILGDHPSSHGLEPADQIRHPSGEGAIRENRSRPAGWDAGGQVEPGSAATGGGVHWQLRWFGKAGDPQGEDVKSLFLARVESAGNSLLAPDVLTLELADILE